MFNFGTEISISYYQWKQFAVERLNGNIVDGCDVLHSPQFVIILIDWSQLFDYYNFTISWNVAYIPYTIAVAVATPISMHTNECEEEKQRKKNNNKTIFSVQLEWNRMEFLFAIFHFSCPASSIKHQFIHIRMVLRYEKLKYFRFFFFCYISSDAIDIWIVIISCIAHSAYILIVVWINDLWIDTCIDKSVRRCPCNSLFVPQLFNYHLNWILICNRKEYICNKHS